MELSDGHGGGEMGLGLRGRGDVNANNEFGCIRHWKGEKYVGTSVMGLVDLRDESKCKQ